MQQLEKQKQTKEEELKQQQCQEEEKEKAEGLYWTPLGKNELGMFQWVVFKPLYFTGAFPLCMTKAVYSDPQHTMPFVVVMTLGEVLAPHFVRCSQERLLGQNSLSVDDSLSTTEQDVFWHESKRRSINVHSFLL